MFRTFRTTHKPFIILKEHHKNHSSPRNLDLKCKFQLSFPDFQNIQPTLSSVLSNLNIHSYIIFQMRNNHNISSLNIFLFSRKFPPNWGFASLLFPVNSKRIIFLPCSRILSHLKGPNHNFTRNFTEQKVKIWCGDGCFSAVKKKKTMLKKLTKRIQSWANFHSRKD